MRLRNFVNCKAEAEEETGSTNKRIMAVRLASLFLQEETKKTGNSGNCGNNAINTMPITSTNFTMFDDFLQQEGRMDGRTNGQTMARVESKTCDDEWASFLFCSM